MTSSVVPRPSSAEYDVIVIGAGSNGLVAAAALGRAGRRVCVVESAAEIGGLRRVEEFAPGFQTPLSVDTGWVPPIVARGLGILPIGITQPLTGASVAGDGDVLSLPCESTRAYDEIHRFSPRGAKRWIRAHGVSSRR